MTVFSEPRGGATASHRDAAASIDDEVAVDRLELPAALDLVKLALRSVNEAKARYPDYRLTRLVSARLELEDEDALALYDLIGLSRRGWRPASEDPRCFDELLREVIDRHALQRLFVDDNHAPHHHAIRPTGYDFIEDQVIPIGMEQWRADYRAMSDERQMLAASIIWLYRGGKDNVWLRRVPCTWHAADAIAHLRDRGCLPDWAGLFVAYPGW